jgi:hypothetical protein
MLSLGLDVPIDAISHTVESRVVRLEPGVEPARADGLLALALGGVRCVRRWRSGCPIHEV